MLIVNMRVFATEFPVAATATRASFVANVVAWLRGTNYSKVLEKDAEVELNTDFSHLKTATGEELLLREVLDDSAPLAIGIRHQIPDDRGRLWRTEAVLKFADKSFEHNLVRIRTQCLAKELQAPLEFPKKPYLVKSLLTDLWGGTDGKLTVTDKPIWLGTSEEYIELATAVVTGAASKFLPVVYISAIGDNEYEISKDLIDKLAYDLGGIAHVVVEPDRNFSFKLRYHADSLNVYGGTIGIYAPKNGLMSRAYLNPQLRSASDLASIIRHSAIGIRSQMPATGWDWSSLQEFALRQHRETHAQDSDFAEFEKIYLDEIKALNEQNESLRETIISLNSSLKVDQLDPSLSERRFDEIKCLIGEEIYDGEIIDRLRFAAKIALNSKDREGIDDRSIGIYSSITEGTTVTRGLTAFLGDLKRATADNKNLHIKISALMARHGFEETTQNKHAKLTPRNGMIGLGPITVPLTSSDHRAGQNQRSQIINLLGLSKLDF